MYALGLIETRGLVTAIEAADVMVKSSDVSIIEKTYIGGGLVTIAVTGDVSAVKSAVEAGGAAVRKINEKALISEHVIPRPHEELEGIIGTNASKEPLEILSSSNEENLEKLEEVLEKKEEIKKEAEKHIEEFEGKDHKVDENQENFNSDLGLLNKGNLQALHKEDVDNLVNKDGVEKTLLMISKLKVVKLRNLAREYDDFGIKGRSISKADKNLLIGKFRSYYNKN